MRGAIALVTGASGGIGSAIAGELASAGAEIIMLGRSMSRLRAAMDAAAIADAEFALADLTDPAAVERVAAEIAERRRLDVLVLGSGVYERSEDLRAFRQQIEANVLGPYALLRAVLPVLIASAGQVVFVNSSQALRASAAVGQYAASMHAMKAVADSLRDEVNPQGVRVTSLFLGRTAGRRQERIFATEGRAYCPDHLLQPGDIARTVRHVLELPRTAEVTELSIRPMRKA